MWPSLWLLVVSFHLHSASSALARNFMRTKCSFGYIDQYTQPPFHCNFGPQSLLQFLLFPVSIDEFISEYYDRRPLHISRGNNREYYAPLGITDAYQDILQCLDTRSDIVSIKQPIGYYPELVASKHDGTRQQVKPWRADTNKRYLDTLSPEQIALIHQYHEELNHDLGPWDHA
eukprot:355383_1